MSGEDHAYLQNVRLLPCCARELGPCSGRIEAHHASELGLGLRAHDHETASMCTSHHLYHWHERKGVFSGWDRARRAAWESDAVARTREMVDQLTRGMEIYL